MENEKPVVLEFTGSFCSGCAMMAPLVEEAEQKYGDRIAFCQVDADHNEMINTALGVQTLPAFLLFDHGHMKEHHEGFWAQPDFDETLKNFADHA